MSIPEIQRNALCLLTPVAAACLLAACGGGSGGGTTYSGVVTSSAYVAGGASGDPAIKPGYYAGATVFVDTNGNGRLDPGEPSVKTDSTGHFTLTTGASGQLVADVPASAINTASGQSVAGHLILRASTAQIADQGAGQVVISPMSSEVQRLVEANGTSYATEKANLGSRLTGPSFGASSVTVGGGDALGDVNALAGAEQQTVLFEDNQLASRYTYATAKLDRGDLYPDNLAVPGGDPVLVGLAGVTQATAVAPLQQQAPITFAQSQQAAFDVEGIPRYDNIFVIMMENHSVGAVPGTPGILGSPDAPNINQILTTGNQFTTYYSTGNPSEPNYLALGGGDDWGITDDNWWGCATSGNNAPTDAAFAGGTASDGQPLVATAPIPTPPGTTAMSSLLSGYGSSSCAAGASAVHNVSTPNLFTLLSQAGMTWRTYSESMNPGQDPRTDSIADAAVSATYQGPGGNGQAYTVPGALYKTKHNPGMAYQQTRSLPEFFADNRTIFGTQYTAADWAKSTDYPVPAGYNYDQFSTDLATGDMGNINFVMPDQCDDMHGTGSDPSCAGSSSNIVQRGDAYVGQVVQKIQASPLWNNPYRHVAIVVMFDEGEGSATSCCGWNPATSNVGQSPLVYASGKYSQTSPAPTDYYQGNHGHGNSIFAVLTNQANAPKGIVDSDAYSHFSFVRTLQDMFGLADPALSYSYLARAKYTESFIANNILNLPELAGSADTHFDSVRPMNHAFVTPASYTQKLNPIDVTGTSLASRSPGPDPTQLNVWALTK